MRKYQPAWNKLKKNPNENLVISAHPAYHRRIYKAIIKEKDLDTIYKFELSESGREAKLSKQSIGNALIIALKITVAIHAVFD